jgi:serine/threonine protein kinase
MDAETTSLCAQCGAMSTRRIEGLCPSCLAAGAASALTALLQPKPAEAGDLAVQIDGVDIESVLGVGAMGIVYRGVREDTDEPIAIKVLARSISEDAEMAERFRREAEALASLDHPNIVRIVSVGETEDGRYYLAMELVEGCDLRRLLDAGRIGTDQALDIFIKVCQGLESAHGKGVIHRDIKPANILVGNDGKVKVADFGIAKAVAGSLSSFTLTQTREAFGTPYYMAPEVARRGVADERADIYALGVLLYQLLTGQVPMGSFTPASKIAAVPSQFDAVITRAMSDDATKRHASVRELRTSVEHIRDSQTVAAKRRRLWMMTALVVGSAAVITLAAMIGIWWQRETSQPAPPPAPRYPTTASKEQPWENSLGMKFVPVPGLRSLFSVYETRRGEYAQSFAPGHVAPPPWIEDSLKARTTDSILTLTAGGWSMGSGSWSQPGFPQTDEHPVVGLNFHDCRSFCDWLTWKEQREGLIGPTMRYRMPSSREWAQASDCKADEDSDSLLSPAKVAPVLASANFAGEEVRQFVWPAVWPTWQYRDDYPRTAPCGSFPANRFGLHDLFRNAAEWVVIQRPQLEGKSTPSLALRGGSWALGIPASVVHTAREIDDKVIVAGDHGFRVVLDLDDTYQ